MVEEVSSMVEDAPTGGQAPPILKEGGAMGLAEAAEAPPVKMEPGALDAEGPPPPQEEDGGGWGRSGVHRFSPI